MQGLVVVGLIFEEIPNIDVKCVSHWSAKYRSRSPGQGTCRVSTSRRSNIQGFVAEGLTVEDIWKGDVKGVKVKGVRNIGQGHCICTLRRSTMQGLVVVGLIVEEILNIDVKCVKCIGAQNI